MVNKNGKLYGYNTDSYGHGHINLVEVLSDKLLWIKNPNSDYLIKAKDVYKVTKFIENVYGRES